MNKKNPNFYSLFFFLSLLITLHSSLFCASLLNLETEYQLRGLAYPNLDYDTSTSTDSRAYYTQRLRLTIKGNFSPGVEICTKLQSIGTVASTTTWQTFDWQKQYPYPNTNFVPFIENAYVKIIEPKGYPFSITIGRQPLEYGTGLIISDNGAGLNALKLTIDYPKIPFGINENLRTEIFTAKIAENFFNSRDLDIQGIVFNLPIKGKNYEFSYIEQNDFTGTIYSQGPKTTSTEKIIKQFYDFRLHNSGKWGFYSAEYVLQKGEIITDDDTKIKLDGKAIVLQGRLIGEKTKLGKATGYGILAGTTGTEEVGTVPETGWYKTDHAFTPDFTKRFDGLNRYGWGKFFSASTFDSMWDVPKTDVGGGNKVNAYSGFGTFGFGLDFSPWFGWTFGAAGYYYSAATAYIAIPKRAGAAATSGSNSPDVLLNILLGKGISERYSLGAELDLFVKYSFSKYVDFTLSYARYTPSAVDIVWPKRETCEQFLFETNCRF